MNQLQIIQLNDSDKISKALSLVWDVFLKFETPDYTQEGIDEFYQTIHNNEYINSLTIYGAYQAEQLLGVIATRHYGTHIALFFVNEKYQKLGIGRQLFQTVLEKNKSSLITVNSSPYAVVVYHKLGFKDSNKEQVINGLKFTPMEMKIL